MKTRELGKREEANKETHCRRSPTRGQQRNTARGHRHELGAATGFRNLEAICDLNEGSFCGVLGTETRPLRSRLGPCMWPNN